MTQHIYETFQVVWRGITIDITYERNWLRIDGYAPCHLTLRSVRPEHEPLPLTRTGYRSHFTDPAYIDEAGGPVAYVLQELEAAAKGREWGAQKTDSSQLELF